MLVGVGYKGATTGRFLFHPGKNLGFRHPETTLTGDETLPGILNWKQEHDDIRTTAQPSRHP